MTRQWIRECQLEIVGAESRGLDFSAFRIAFEVRKTATPSPNDAKIRIYNLSAGTAQQAKKEFKRVRLKAGYRGAAGIIFDGNIKEARIGRAGTETHLDIIAGDGDESYVHSTVSKTLAAGCSCRDVFDAAATTMREGGVSLGKIDDFDPVSFPRGRVMFGMSRNFIESACRTQNMYWSIQDMKINTLKHKNALPEIFVISEDTGMVGVPEEVNEGVKVRCLLNPDLRVDGQVKIESKYISEIAASAAGLYRVLQIDFSGDTHGDDWHADLICVAMSGGQTTDSEGRNG